NRSTESHGLLHLISDWSILCGTMAAKSKAIFQYSLTLFEMKGIETAATKVQRRCTNSAQAIFSAWYRRKLKLNAPRPQLRGRLRRPRSQRKRLRPRDYLKYSKTPL